MAKKSATTAKTKTIQGGLILREDDMTIIGVQEDTPEKELEHVVIPEGVKKIGQEAFLDQKSMVSIKFPESLVRIDEMAFHNCYGLKEIVFPKNVESIGKYAFLSCEKLKKAELNEGLKFIEDGAFFCTKIRELELPKSIRVVGSESLIPVERLVVKDLLPYNLIRSIVTMSSYDYSMCKDTDMNMVAEIEVNGRKIFIPKFSAEKDAGALECALNAGIREMEKNFFIYAPKGRASYDTAFAMYSYLVDAGEEPTDELKEYIKKISKKMSEVMISFNRIQDVTKVIKLGLLTKSAMKSLYELSVRQNRSDIAAYILEEIRQSEKQTSMRL